MTDQHPLTDELCLTIDDNSMIDEDDWKGYMRAAADWQLEQVVEWIKINADHYVCEDSHTWEAFLEDFKRAMRSATT